MTDQAWSRRDLLRLGALAVPAAVASSCGWDGGRVLAPRLRAFSGVNDWVSENIFLSHRHHAPTYPLSARTPADRFPVYALSHPLPTVADPSAWVLEVGGLVRNPLRLSLSALQALPSLRYTVKHHCVEGWTAIATWTGVPLTTIVAMAAPTDAAEYLRIDSFDRGYSNGWDLKSATHPQTILAYAWNDRPLTPAHGAPLRLYAPIKLGYKLTKYVRSLTFTSSKPGGYWEDQGYPWFGGI
jgi:DMSO/TMAO reductase YedYZ molybdopterin-dependent catalytic subunit